jgi:hypothetical protein
MKLKKFDETPEDAHFLMKQKHVKRVLEEEAKDFDIEKIFDKSYKEGKKVKMAPKKKKKAKDVLEASFTKKGAVNKSFYTYEKY